MTDKHRAPRAAWRFNLLPCLALAVAGCVSPANDGDGSGGSSSASGGKSGTGGATSTGGTTASGGVTSSGGATASGGVTASGGATAVGGKPGSGGATASGGATSSGGQISSGGQTGAAGKMGDGGGKPGAAGSSGTGTGGTTGGGGSAAPGKSLGCGQTSTLKFTTVPGESGTNVGTGEGGYVTIQSGGGSRGFAVRLPTGYDKTKPYWLIFGFHWNGGTAKDVDTGGSNGYLMAHFGLQKLSNNGAIFVAPQGIGNGWGNSGGNDLKFVDDMVKLMTDNYCVDTSHIMTNGFSYGGGMSYELACARANAKTNTPGYAFRAAAIYEGAQLSGCDGGNDPIALWQMVGLEDTTCGMNLATPIRDRFVKNNGCTAQSPPQPAKGPPYSATAGHICTDYAGCSSGHPLRWCVHQSGHGNAIVDGNNSLYNECGTPPKMCSASCKCSWVPDDVWKFFTAL